MAVLGERPAAVAWVGIVAAAPALWLESQASVPGRAPGSGPPVSAGVPSALVTSAGFGVQFLAMAQVGADGGLWPLVISRVSSVLVIAAVLVRYRSSMAMPGRLTAVAAPAGGVGTLAIILYLAATRHQLMAVATVLSALYPAIPVLLALVSCTSGSPAGRPRDWCARARPSRRSPCAEAHHPALNAPVAS